MAKSILFSFFCLCYLSGDAQVEKIDTDRPDQTESAVTVPKNYFQAEFGFNKENLYFRNYDLIHPTMLLKYGLNRFEIRLEATYKSSYVHLIPEPEWTTGFDPVVIGFKAALFEEKKLRPKTSLIVHLALPKIASRAFRAERLAPEFRFTMQHSITEQVGLSYNLGAEWDGFSRSPIWLYTFAPGINIGDKWYTYIEIFGFFPKNEKAQHNLDAGIAYYISPDVKVDISGGVGITDAAPENYMALGFSLRLNTRRTKK
jgi:hypothetical protein